MKYEIQITKQDHELSVQFIGNGKILDPNKMFREDQFLFLGLLAEVHNQLADKLMTSIRNI